MWIAALAVDAGVDGCTREQFRARGRPILAILRAPSICSFEAVETPETLIHIAIILAEVSLASTLERSRADLIRLLKMYKKRPTLCIDGC